MQPRGAGRGGGPLLVEETLEEVTEGAQTLGRLVLLAVVPKSLLFVVVQERFARETNPVSRLLDLQDLHLELRAHGEHPQVVGAAVRGHLSVGDQTHHAGRDLQEDAVALDAGDFALADLAHLDSDLHRLPRLGHLGGDQAHALAVLVDLLHHDVDLGAHLEHLTGALDPALSGDGGDVQEPVDPLGDIDEGAEILEPNHGALEGCADLELAHEVGPRVGLETLGAEGHSALLGLYSDDLHLHGVAFAESLPRMVYPAVADLADVNHAFDAVAEIDESPEVGQLGHLPLDPISYANPLAESAHHGLSLRLQKDPTGEDKPLSLIEFGDPELVCLAHLSGLFADEPLGHLRRRTKTPHAVDSDLVAALVDGHHLALDGALGLPGLPKVFDGLIRFGLLVTQLHRAAGGDDLDLEGLGIDIDLENLGGAEFAWTEGSHMMMQGSSQFTEMEERISRLEEQLNRIEALLNQIANN